jgi:outer membrane autotransporter protein
VVAPLDGAVYGNLMRIAMLNGQHDLAELLNQPFAPSDGASAGSDISSLGPSSAQSLADAGMPLQPRGVGHAADDPSGSDASTPPSSKGKVWAHVSGSSISLSGSPGFDGYSLLLGTDGRLADALHLGVEAGAGQIRAQRAESGGRSRINNVHAGVYAFGNAGPVVLSGTIDYLHGRYRVYRQTGIGDAEARPDGDILSAGLQAAWPITLSDGNLTPKVGVLYQHQKLDGFHETVASSNPLASAFGVDSTGSVATSLQPYGAIAWSGMFTSGTTTWVPDIEIGYRYQAHRDNPAVALTAQDGTLFMVPGTQVGRSMATVKARVTALVGGAWSVYVNYGGYFADHLHDNALSVGFSKRF